MTRVEQAALVLLSFGVGVALMAAAIYVVAPVTTGFLLASCVISGFAGVGGLLVLAYVAYLEDTR